MKLWCAILVVALALLSGNAFAAKRLGGGKSMGQQSSNVTKRETASNPAPGAPITSPNTAAAKQPATTTPTPAPAAPAPRPWGAMLGGLAAGLGLAWLAHSFGLGAEFGQFLMFALIGLVAMVAIGWFIRSRRTASNDTVVRSPYAYEGASASPTSAPIEVRNYNPANVGNDASARPWERQSMAFDAAQTQAAQGSMIGSALHNPLEGNQTWGIPSGFDAEGFLDSAKRNFVTLQGAWDRADVATLRTMMTDDMLHEIQGQLSEREKASPNATSVTEVLMLNAQLLGIEETPTHYMASVEFSGMIREDVANGPAPFREVWNMTKTMNGSSGWLVAGLQALQ